MKQLRIGFLSTANIGRKNWKAIYNSGNCIVTAVASRDLQRSQAFIRECQHLYPFKEVPQAFGTYEELFRSSNVDAVYIPLPTGVRRDFVLRAARHGKHVICEKPCAVEMPDLERMLEECKKHDVQFMDGVMFMHSPRLKKIRRLLDDGKNIGGIRRISSAFSFFVGEEFFRHNIRVNGALEPAGCLGDLGWYCIRFALWALNWQMPKSVSAKILSQSEALKNRPAAPTEFSAELIFSDNISVGLYCSFLARSQQWVHLSGQKGWLRVPDFVHPFNSYEPAFELNEKFVTVAGKVKCPAGTDSMIQGHATAQDALMFRKFAKQIDSGKLNDEWPMWALKTQRVMDMCLRNAVKGK